MKITDIFIFFHIVVIAGISNIIRVHHYFEVMKVIRASDIFCLKH